MSRGCERLGRKAKFPGGAMTRAVFDTIWTLALGPLNEAIDSTGIFRRKVKFMIGRRRANLPSIIARYIHAPWALTLGAGHDESETSP
jgi:hypothetical protein